MTEKIEEKAAALEKENAELRAEVEKLKAVRRAGKLMTHDLPLVVVIEAPRSMPIVTTNAPTKGGLIQTHGRALPDAEERTKEILKDAIAERTAKAKKAGGKK